MATTALRIGIVGRDAAAKPLVDRLMAIDGVTVVGCSLADTSTTQPPIAEPIRSFEDHSELIRQAAPDALVLSTPNRSFYRPAMDGLQAGCHLLITSPLSTSVQEAVDIVGLARARERKVSVGHGFRRSASLVVAREMITSGAIGRLRLVTVLLAELAIDGLDALLWSAGKPAELVSAIQSSAVDGPIALITASIRLGDGLLASLTTSGGSPGPSFRLVFHGERGRLRAMPGSLVLEEGDEERAIPLPEVPANVFTEFVASIREGASVGRPAEDVLDSVRLLEAISRSATIGQFVGLA